MKKLILIKPITTEKSFKNQDEGYYTFLVNPDANKREIMKEVERIFDVQVENVTTSNHQSKIRQLRGKRYITRRKAGKVARIRLKKDSKKIDLAKVTV